MPSVSWPEIINWKTLGRLTDSYAGSVNQDVNVLKQSQSLVNHIGNSLFLRDVHLYDLDLSSHLTDFIRRLTEAFRMKIGDQYIGAAPSHTQCQSTANPTSATGQARGACAEYCGG